MEVKLFYRTQRDLAIAVNQLIDAYWNEKIDESILIDGIKNMHLHNEDKLMKNNQFTTIIRQQCGKRRLAIVEKILEK